MTDGSYVVAQKRAAGLVPNVKNPFAALVKVDIIKLSQKQVKYGATLGARCSTVFLVSHLSPWHIELHCKHMHHAFEQKSQTTF